jgi:ABC-type oligopeptide transport system substrate-binding subunit
MPRFLRHSEAADLLYNTSDLHKKLAIAAASLWRKNLGIDVKLVNQSESMVFRNEVGSL